MHIHELLMWRYATKKFDTEKTLEEADLNYVLQAGNFAATSFGLQPFGIVAVTDEAKKKELRAAAFDQEHVEHNGALLVVCARTDVNDEFVSEFARRTEKVRDLEEGAVSEYEAMIKGTLADKSKEEILTWSQKQAYIVLGTMMLAAPDRQLDACPMEGFQPDEFDRILDLKPHNLRATCLLALGFRSEEDETQHHAKVRRSLEDTVVYV